jgi:hypothetical protein
MEEEKTHDEKKDIEVFGLQSKVNQRDRVHDDLLSFQ